MRSCGPLIVLRPWYDYTILNSNINPSSRCRYKLPGCQTKLILKQTTTKTHYRYTISSNRQTARSIELRVRASCFRVVQPLVTMSICISVNRLEGSGSMSPGKLDALRLLQKPCLGQITTAISPPVVSAVSEAI